MKSISMHIPNCSLLAAAKMRIRNVRKAYKQLWYSTISVILLEWTTTADRRSRRIYFPR